MGLKELVLKQGWAGRTLSRSETIERINPIIGEMNELMYAYTAALDEAEPSVRAEIEPGLKKLRADIGKLMEIVFSCGGTPPNGTDLETDQFEYGSQALRRLSEREDGLSGTLKGELDLEHEMHTRAVLSVVAANLEERRRVLRNRTR